MSVSCSAHATSAWLRAGAFHRTQSRYRYGSKWFSFAVSIRLYFWIADMKNTMQRWDEWLRRRFRVYIWKQWKVPSARIRNLIKLGIPKRYARKWGYLKAYWNVAGSPILTQSITNERLARAGYYSLSDRYESLHLCD